MSSVLKDGSIKSSLDGGGHFRKRRIHVQRPKERKRATWYSEVVKGIGAGISKGDWQTKPEK